MRIEVKKEAETCRRKVLDFKGKPEAAFLLRLAQAFDDLAEGHGDARAAATR